MRDGTFVILRMGREAIPIDKMANKRILDCLPNSAKYYIAEKKILSQVDHDKLGLKSSKRLYKHRTMLTDDIANRIFCGAVKCRPVIKQLKKRSVEFVDGTIVDDVDAIICATGYNVTFPYIDIVA
ncbi:dimethylaniline monooxygenase [N-oxide-forming] 2-like, partial [Saccoglossus kowalevskii]